MRAQAPCLVLRDVRHALARPLVGQHLAHMGVQLPQAYLHIPPAAHQLVSQCERAGGVALDEHIQKFIKEVLAYSA